MFKRGFHTPARGPGKGPGNGSPRHPNWTPEEAREMQRRSTEAKRRRKDEQRQEAENHQGEDGGLA